MLTSLINEAMEIEVHATDQNAAIVSVHMERPSTAIVCFNQILEELIEELQGTVEAIVL
jgi:hypothetical protein